MQAKILIQESHHRCECCGSYENVEATITVSGKTDIRSYNTHLGGDGSWQETSEYVELFLSVINLLGYMIELTSKDCRLPNFELDKQKETMDREGVLMIGAIPVSADESTLHESLLSVIEDKLACKLLITQESIDWEY